jgi:glucose/arabinose dehydrogenase
MWGGRFTNSNKNIFLSIGEQRFDRSGFPKKDLKIIDPITTNIFGTVLKFSLNLDEWVVFATGLRNPQGLFWDEGSKRLFESEHGPNGGDEINILEEGLNYGWPYTSFGKPYAKKYPSGVDELDQARNPRIGVEIELKKLISQSDFHSGHTLPIFSWIPGVGAGNLLYMNKNTILKDWRDNLIVAHMGNKELHRLVLSKNKVLLDEKILLGFRVRDILINQNGILYFSSDDGTLMAYHTYDSKLD